MHTNRCPPSVCVHKQPGDALCRSWGQLGDRSKAKHKHVPEAWLAATPEVTTVEVSESKLQSPELVTVENITHYSGHGSLSELIKCSFCRSRLGVPLVLNNPHQSKRVANSGHRFGTMTLYVIKTLEKGSKKTNVRAKLNHAGRIKSAHPLPTETGKEHLQSFQTDALL